MRGMVNIGEHGVEMLATASTPIRLRQVFGIDYFSIITKEVEEGQMIDLYSKLGFIMAKQAEGADMTAVTQEDYLAWLDQFEPLDVVLAAQDISGLYDRQAATTAKTKKASGRPSGRTQ